MAEKKIAAESAANAPRSRSTTCGRLLVPRAPSVVVGGCKAARPPAGTKGTKARYQVKPSRGRIDPDPHAPAAAGLQPVQDRVPGRQPGQNTSLFPEGGDVTVEDLVAKGAVRGGAPVKVLGTGEISVKVNVTADAASASAKDKIEAAGGSVTIA